MPKISDLGNQIKEEKKEKEDLIISGVWRCAHCGTKFELMIYPYYSNIPEYCMNPQCPSNKLNLKNKRFLFIKWDIFKGE